MTPQSLLALHTRGLFPYEAKFTWVRCVAPSVPGGTEAGDLVSHFGFPSVVSERQRSGMRAVPDRYVVHAWLPASLAAEEIAAGRFAEVAVQPRLAPAADESDNQPEKP